MRFSIIIPVYNVEKYIRRCMDTVMNQTFEDYEVIVVNDETPDNSMAIVQEFVDAFPGKIQVLHQKNTRQGGARNNGVRHARGEYLIFVDSDDYISLDMLSTVDQRLRETPCDILVFHHVTVTESGVELAVSDFSGLKPGVYHPAEDPQIMMLPNGPVNKAYLRSFYLESGVQFPEKVLYEDAVVRLLYAKAKTMVLTEDRLYYYVQSGESTMRRSVSEKMLDILTMTDLVCREFREAGLYEHFREPLEMSLTYGIVYIIDIINRVDLENPMQCTLTDYIGVNFPSYTSNPYGSEELRRALDCLLAHRFRRYHYRFLIWNGMKDKLLQLPLAEKLNTLRKKH